MASTKSSRVPLQIYSLDGRYATALYTSAKKTGTSTLEAISKDMNTLSKYLKQDAKVMAFLEDPTQPRSQKKDIITTIVDKLGLGKSSSGPNILLNTLHVMTENGRLGLLTRVISSFEDIMSAHHKEIPVTLISAKELDASYRQQVNDRITSQFIPKGFTPIFNNVVNPSILGGLIIHIADRTIDMSVASKVSKMNQELARAI